MDLRSNADRCLLAAIGPARLGVAFQPIVDLADGTVVAYEVLGRGLASRDPHGRTRGPQEIIEMAVGEGTLAALEHEWRRRAVEVIARDHAQGPVRFHFNVDPRVLDDPAFEPGFTLGLLNRYGLAPERFVFEFTETSSALGDDRLVAIARHYASQGFEIAVDDVGAGFASLSVLVRLRPDLIKLDLALVRGLARDPWRWHLVSALARFGRETGVQVVAEGIETRDDLDAVVAAGVRLGQGYHLGRPALQTWPPPGPLPPAGASPA